MATSPQVPEVYPLTPDAPTPFGPYMGPGKGAPNPFAVGPPGLGTSNLSQHGSGADASRAAASDDVAEGRSAKRRVGEDSRPREPSPMVTPGGAGPRQGKGAGTVPETRGTGTVPDQQTSNS